MTVGERIRERRKECGMTQAEVAKKAGISRSYFSDVEKEVRLRLKHLQEEKLHLLLCSIRKVMIYFFIS